MFMMEVTNMMTYMHPVTPRMTNMMTYMHPVTPRMTLCYPSSWVHTLNV